MFPVKPCHRLDAGGSHVRCHTHAYRARRNTGRGFGHRNQKHAFGRRFPPHDEPDERRGACKECKTSLHIAHERPRSCGTDRAEHRRRAARGQLEIHLRKLCLRPRKQPCLSLSLKFAALADERGTCTSLFIYGKSGLGKTHLLLAIKNELAEKSPEIKVKYANSQAYLDDLMTEFDRQKKSNAPIMQAYHDVDVLIIDDIQNIIGKRASVDYFFQLMDEFIRNNKKVVIAADRAPKDLSMDERLTSRFNAGMLCLVAEPSYEMKYKILQRYYENTIAAAPEAGDDSLLAAYGGDGGHLTDEHFKHMAEVSGTNIRELESFCERCAGEAGDREREGSELSFDDIDAIASQYFDTSAKMINVQTVQSVIEEQYGVTHEELIGPRRNANIAKARHIAIYLAIEMCEMTTTAVGAEFATATTQPSVRAIKRFRR